MAYALLGCTWLIMKTEHELHRKMSALATPLLIALLVIIGVISIWTPFTHENISHAGSACLICSGSCRCQSWSC